MTTTLAADSIDSSKSRRVEELPHAAVRFAGDSGDGMQLAGTQFTNTSAVLGNDIATLPDYPAEIRAPAGTLAGVSGFQINFSNHNIHTPGDKVDALIAMNPAAMKTNLKDLIDGGILIVNIDEFTPIALQKAKYEGDPFELPEFQRVRVYKVPISKHTLEAVKESGLAPKEAERCKNIYALGIVFWLYDRPLETTLKWIHSKFGSKAGVAKANELALRAGYNFGETAELFPVRYKVRKASLPPGRYRNVTGNQAAALGCVAAAKLAGKPLVYSSYPITPASEILQELSALKAFNVRTFQAEDEIAAMCSTVGAAFTGAIAVTGTSGPGVALKQEGIGLAVILELPSLIINVQRGGPSTGLPTKTEQADLWQAVMGRNGECPMPVIAAESPADCFWAVVDAARIAVKYMTPVMVLSDGYVANGSEPWRIPTEAELPPIASRHPTDPAEFQPYLRDAHGSRPWALPGTPGFQHRVGGLEKEHVTGDISYDPANHQLMVDLRAQKVANVAKDIPTPEVYGDPQGELLVVTWGGTFGTVRTAVERARDEGKSVSHLHLRWVNPMPSQLGEILARFRTVLVAELNMGQLEFLLRAQYLIEPLALHKVQGKPFQVAEIQQKIDEILSGMK
ncbi:MAG: 2-oxoacid:acceptor oxidoreductase subunit alpha [Planctomycetes bacterium]|nr:2-oxoacid:acceptor oxidoreductase subunit alpha [Planctomycetota bacterium]